MTRTRTRARGRERDGGRARDVAARRLDAVRENPPKILSRGTSKSCARRRNTTRTRMTRTRTFEARLASARVHEW